MSEATMVTVAEFLADRFELPEAGQWSELEHGQLVHRQPPDLDHGTVVLNLSKAIAEYLQSTRQGYACFDLGLHLKRCPDTVRFPAACFFVDGPRFTESDRQVTTTVPALVMEISSTADRRRLQPERSLEFLAWGVTTVWVIHPQEQLVNIFQTGQTVHTVTTAEWLADSAVLSDFRMPVSSLFAEPSWWNARP